VKTPGGSHIDKASTNCLEVTLLWPVVIIVHHRAAEHNQNVAPQRKFVGIKTKMLEHPRSSPPIASYSTRSRTVDWAVDSTAIWTNSPCDESAAYLTTVLDATNLAAAPSSRYEASR